MTNDLQTIVDALRANPDVLKTGIKAGNYSVAYGKIWRGSTVIGYVPSSPPEGTALELLHTSNTTAEEAAIFRSPAPPTPASAPAMTLDSPEGREAEEKPPGGEQPPPAPPTGGEQPSQEVIGPGENAPEQPPSASSGAEKGVVFKKKPTDAAGLGAPRGESFYPEAYAVLNESRMIETRRKLLKANATVEFDLECKNVTRGVWVHLWLLPSKRIDGKFELYTHTVTSTCNVPSVYSIKRDLVSAMHDEMPHIVVSDASVSAIARKINLAMSAAKDSLGGDQRAESIEDEIEGYLVEN